MAEPRMRLRSKGQVFSTQDLSDMLFAFGDQAPSLNTTVTTLDEILTDFVIETCHAAALCASYSRRQKIKIDDFKWVLRKDTILLGRVMEQMWREKKMKDERKVGGMDFNAMSREEMQEMAELGGVGPEDEAVGKGKRGRRRKRRAEDEPEGAPVGKRMASGV
ncbi:hypothetical protein K431DRAFT_284867 [Polychaeton citri CBS 116435]|uniref:Transcription initiation factor TFIID subunit 13 n=1 Tax=Polychaeton citri CBS 116435 TaxID=1314669 RepID=A0A9P4QB87_9PEZI|nr:hypothetical protein K431DRAFT_284867 [Polychaeton citri CBS 116435]